MVTVLGLIDRPQDKRALERAIAYLRAEQEADGSWFGRWGTNYIYGTWSVLTAFAQAGVEPEDPAVRRAVGLVARAAEFGWRMGRDQRQLPQGLARGRQRAEHPLSHRLGAAWPCSRRAKRNPMRRGARSIICCGPSGSMACGAMRRFTAPGFPRVFYLKYHGYCAFFPLWALGAYRTLTRAGTAH